MKKNKNLRFSHAGKNYYEKEAYRKFLKSTFNLDKTVDDPVDIKKTNESSVEDYREEDKGGGENNVKRKSPLLKIKDFLYDNWIIAFVSALIVALILAYASLNRELGINSTDITTLKSDIQKIQTSNQNNQSTFNLLKERFDIFSTGVEKDIEYIKKRLNI